MEMCMEKQRYNYRKADSSQGLSLSFFCFRKVWEVLLLGNTIYTKHLKGFMSTLLSKNIHENSPGS